MSEPKKKADPTNDDISRRLRPIRAEYVRKVRQVSKPPEDNDGCLERIFPVLVLLFIAGTLTYFCVSVYLGG